MRRREFIAALGGTAAWPLALHAQQSVPVVGLVVAASPAPYASRVRAFNQGLAEIGYVDGRDVSIEYRWSYDQNDQIPALVADLIRKQATVIVAGGTRTALAAKAATSTIPIVFYTVTNPVEAGLVASLNQPGSNVTGITSLGSEVGPKRLELLHEMVPKATVIGVLINPSFPSFEAQTKDIQEAARRLGLRLEFLHAGTEHGIDEAFATAARLKAGAIVIATDPLFTARSERLAEHALRIRAPAIYQYREFAAAGGLMSYGDSFTEPYRQLGVYAGRILKGEKPSDLPVQQATKFELIINAKTAKAFGLMVPDTLLGRADEVIE
jgi:putative ABC transport system substrate-binding protein